MIFWGLLAMTVPPSHPDSSAPEPDSSAQNPAPHVSVLLNETLEHLAPQPSQCVVDCTLGAGGHSAAFLERIRPNGRLICLDVDPQALAIARARLEPLAQACGVRLDFAQANFSQIGTVLGGMAVSPDIIFADLGVSSMQFDQPERGFSFRFDHPLDMRMDPGLPMTAADILRQYSQEDLANMIYQLGEERQSRRIARAIVYQREKYKPVETTGELEELIRRALRVRGHRRVHPATKTFQALRLEVNRELDALRALLDTAPELLAEGGRLGFITFHSLEDREVKQRFKALAQTGRYLQRVKFVAPSDAEVERNARSRSAKLRVIQKQGAGRFV
jgi:16S rRNA (cytosine1402-N4)-methyltransferase